MQKIAREYRDNHAAAQAEFEKRQADLQAEVERLNATKIQLEEQVTTLQNNTAQTSAADTETLKKLQAEKDDLQGQVQSLKEELERAQEQASKGKDGRDQDEAARKKLEEDMAVQTRRNTALLNDNKKFRAQIQELTAKASASIEEEVQKRIAALPQSTAGEASSGAIDEDAVKVQLSELEARLTAEKEAAVRNAAEETEKRLQQEFAEERAKLTSQAAIAAGSEGDVESIEKKIEEAAAAKITEAVRAREEELQKAKEQEIQSALTAKEAEVKRQTQAQIDQARKQIEATAQTRINNLAKQHKEALEKMQVSHDRAVKTAVEEARAAASNQEAGEITSPAPSQEDIEKAVKTALEQKEQEHQKTLAEKVAEAKEKAKTEFDLKSKLRDTQIAALRKETASLKARLAQASSTESPTSPQIAQTPVQTPAETSAPATNGTPIKGLSIAGRSQSQGATVPVATPMSSTGISIAGSAAGSATTPPRGRGRGRGLARGGAPGAGRGRGNIVGSALNAATDGAAKRTREDEAANGDAKRRKDGES